MTSQKNKVDVESQIKAREKEEGESCMDMVKNNKVYIAIATVMVIILIIVLCACLIKPNTEDKNTGKLGTEDLERDQAGDQADNIFENGSKSRPFGNEGSADQSGNGDEAGSSGTGDVSDEPETEKPHNLSGNESKSWSSGNENWARKPETGSGACPSGNGGEAGSSGNGNGARPSGNESEEEFHKAEKIVPYHAKEKEQDNQKNVKPKYDEKKTTEKIYENISVSENKQVNKEEVEEDNRIKQEEKQRAEENRLKQEKERRDEEFIRDAKKLINVLEPIEEKIRVSKKSWLELQGPISRYFRVESKELNNERMWKKVFYQYMMKYASDKHKHNEKTKEYADTAYKLFMQIKTFVDRYVNKNDSLPKTLTVENGVFLTLNRPRINLGYGFYIDRTFELDLHGIYDYKFDGQKYYYQRRSDYYTKIVQKSDGWTIEGIDHAARRSNVYDLNMKSYLMTDEYVYKNVFKFKSFEDRVKED